MMLAGLLAQTSPLSTGILPTGPSNAMNEYMPMAALFVLVSLFGFMSFMASRLLAPQRPTGPKRAPYECGIVPSREAVERFPVRFYLVAMIFIIFDIEIIFIYPWAVIFKDVGFAKFGLDEMAFFVLPAFISLLYLVSQGALEWGPAKRVRTFRDQSRTSDSTVRRISNSVEVA